MSLKMFLEPRELKLLCRILMIPRNLSSVTWVPRDMCSNPERDSSSCEKERKESLLELGNVIHRLHLLSLTPIFHHISSQSLPPPVQLSSRISPRFDQDGPPTPPVLNTHPLHSRTSTVLPRMLGHSTFRRRRRTRSPLSTAPRARHTHRNASEPHDSDRQREL